MVEIIPSINALTFAEVQEQIAKVEPYVSWCHLDVTDGVFSKHETWRNPQDLALLKAKLNAEVHLMVEEPEEILGQWLVEPIKRVIMHLEAMRDPDLVIRKCHEAGKEVGFAIRPDTPWSLLVPWCGKIDMALILRVSPGASGQAAASDMLGEIRHIREACPGCIVEIDGGVTIRNARKISEAGAGLLVAGSAIFASGDIGGAISALRREAGG